VKLARTVVQEGTELYFENETVVWRPDDAGTHVPLPRDPAQYDAAALWAAARAYWGPEYFDQQSPEEQAFDVRDMRRAIAAYTATVGGGA